MVNIMPNIGFQICPNFGKKMNCDAMYIEIMIEICGQHGQGQREGCLRQKECDNKIPAKNVITKKGQEGLGILLWDNMTFLGDGM